MRASFILYALILMTHLVYALKQTKLIYVIVAGSRQTALDAKVHSHQYYI